MNSLKKKIENCGIMDCKRIEMMSQATLPPVSWANYQRVGAALPLIGHSYDQ